MIGSLSDATPDSSGTERVSLGDAIAAALQRERTLVTADALRGFSSPGEPFAAELFDAIVAAHARVSLEHFLAVFGAEVDRFGAGLRAFLREAVKAMPALGGRLWNPAFSFVYRSVEGRCCAPPAHVAAQAALSLGAEGLGGAWSVDFGREVGGLRWANWILPPATGLAVECDGRQATIAMGGRQLTLSRTGERWTAAGGGRPATTLIEPLGRIPLLDAGALPPWERDDLQPLIPVRSVTSDLARAYAGAVGILSQHVPSWIPWFVRGLRAIALVEPPGPNQMTSGSSFWSCGQIHISSQTDPMILAEAMVHETSHQYLHVALQLGPIDNGADARTYYSPVVRAQRTVDRVLVAYHAFANVTLFYRALRAAGVPLGPQAERSAGEAEADIDDLSRPLIDNPALTEIGRGIFQPLADKLNQSSR